MLHNSADNLALSLCPREVLCFLTGQGCHSESFVDCGQVENEGSDLTSGAKRGEKLQRETAESEEGKMEVAGHNKHGLPVC